MSPAEAQKPEESPPAPRPRRRWWAFEVIQTSAMDCGPAALKCLLEGFGISVSYGRLREACQTSVDGSSIDTLESVARLLGLDAEQIMAPAEHVLASDSQLPAIAIVRLPSGMTHFVVLWRRVGPFIQVMDPATGRRWVRASVLLGDLLRHTLVVDAEAFQGFVSEPAFIALLAARTADLLGRKRAAALMPTLRQAQQQTAWRPIARWDGALRAVAALRAAREVRSAAQADTVLRALVAADGAGGALNDILDAHACARQAPPSADGTASVSFTGAVLVRVQGRLATDGASPEAVPAALAAALDEKPVRPWHVIAGLWGKGLRRLAWAAGLLVAAVAVGGIAEAFFTRPLLSAPAVDATQAASLPSPARTGFVALCAVVCGAFLIEWPLGLITRRLGRGMDLGLRQAFLRKLPLLGDRYFSSRPVSDMAERAHLLHRVRALPTLAGALVRCWLEMALMTAAIIWLYPPGAPLAVALLIFTGLAPLLGVPALAERDLRLRTHAGSLMRFYLDALLGLSAVRTHRAEGALTREHETRLREWRRAGRDMVRTSLTVESVVVLVAALGAGFLVMGSLGAGVSGGAGLLLLFFALGLPAQAARLIALGRELPDHRNVTLRLIEPLGAPEEHRRAPDHGGDEVAAATAAAAIAFEAVGVEAGGHPILTDLSLTIAPGSHVAVVGASGAGKSTLIGLLLGVYVPAVGRVLVDGSDLNDAAARLVTLREQTVWVDPGVQLWNRSLADNLSYGARTAPTADDLARALADSQLSERVSAWPRGLETPLGEGGGLLSGGEGQRVRLARELVRVPAPRLVLLDEPFRGLDGDTRRRMFAHVRARWTHVTMLVATHDIAHTQEFSRVLVIDGGRLVEDGPPHVLAADPASRYRALLDAEQRVRDRRWASAQWRHWTIRDARVSETAPAASQVDNP